MSLIEDLLEFAADYEEGAVGVGRIARREAAQLLSRAATALEEAAAREERLREALENIAAERWRTMPGAVGMMQHLAAQALAGDTP